MARHGLAEVLTGASVLLVAAGFLGFAIAHSGRSTAAGYPLHAQFDHIDGLDVGADVRIAGVKVGSVTDEHIDPKTFLAMVGFTVRDGIELPKDSSATITSESLLGGKYIAIAPGGDEATLRPGGTITLTQGSISIEGLIGKYIFGGTSKTSDGGPAEPTPGGQTPAGPTPAGQAPGTQTPTQTSGGGQSPGGQAPAGQAPEGQTPEGQTPGPEGNQATGVQRSTDRPDGSHHNSGPSPHQRK